MAARGRHAPLRFERRRSRWERRHLIKPDFPASDEDEDSIIIGPGDERESGAAVLPRG
jgi:hypothetical protein